MLVAAAAAADDNLDADEVPVAAGFCCCLIVCVVVFFFTDAECPSGCAALECVHPTSEAQCTNATQSAGLGWIGVCSGCPEQQGCYYTPSSTIDYAFWSTNTEGAAPSGGTLRVCMPPGAAPVAESGNKEVNKVIIAMKSKAAVIGASIALAWEFIEIAIDLCCCG